MRAEQSLICFNHTGNGYAFLQRIEQARIAGNQKAAVRAGQDAVFVEYRVDIDIGFSVLHTDRAGEFRRPFMTEFQAVNYPFTTLYMGTQ